MKIGAILKPEEATKLQCNIQFKPMEDIPVKKEEPDKNSDATQETLLDIEENDLELD